LLIDFTGEKQWHIFCKNHLIEKIRIFRNTDKGGLQRMISEQVQNIVFNCVESLKNMKFPEDRYYTRLLTWVKVEGDIIKVGLSQPFVCLFSPLIEVIYPNIPVKVGIDTPCAWVKHRDGIFSIRSPAKGNLFKLNERILTEPDILNKDPYFDGWLFEIELDKGENLKRLMNSVEFSEFFNNKLDKFRKEVVRFIDRHCGDEMMVQNGDVAIVTLKDLLGPKRYLLIARLVFGF
jgi:glycine cleavage system H protein